MLLLTGGGADLIYPYIKSKLKNIIQVEQIYNSEFANSQGYYRYGVLLRNNKLF